MTADETSSPTPVRAQDDPLDIALDVLVLAISQLRTESGGTAPTASEVHLRMRALTYGGFKAKNLGFKRFRDFLETAKGRSIVAIDYSRAGDVAVMLPDDVEVDPSMTGLGIRGDLWRAAVDWSPGLLRLYDMTANRVILIPAQPAPLEPDRIADARARYRESPGSFALVRPVEISDQLKWMREFANALDDSVEMSKILLAALEGDRPAKYFVAVLKDSPEFLARWHETLRRKVTQHLQEWVKEAGLHGSLDIFQRPQISPSTHIPTRTSMSRGNTSTERSRAPETLQAILRFASTVAPQLATSSLSADEDLRHRMHRAIDAMPIEELRRIEIPIGYLFGN